MRVAVWGAGKMGWVHGNAYREMGTEIACVIEKDREKAEQFAAEFQCAAFSDPSELEKQNVDVMDICLPSNLHRTALEKASEYCRAVICEKPVCLSPGEFDEIAAIQKKRGMKLMVGQVLRFWEGYVKAMELVRQGAVGKVRFVNCFRRQKRPSWSKGNWLMDEKKSGGILMDLCIHDVDYINWLLGRPESVSCQIVRNEDAVLHGIINMIYDGCCVNIIGSWGMPDGFSRGELSASLEIVGDDGMITYIGDDRIEWIKNSEKRQLDLEKKNGYKEELRYFLECIERGENPERADLASVKGTMEVLWAAAEAGRENRIVALS